MWHTDCWLLLLLWRSTIDNAVPKKGLPSNAREHFGWLEWRSWCCCCCCCLKRLGWPQEIQSFNLNWFELKKNNYVTNNCIKMLVSKIQMNVNNFVQFFLRLPMTTTVMIWFLNRIHLHNWKRKGFSNVDFNLITNWVI